MTRTSVFRCKKRSDSENNSTEQSSKINLLRGRYCKALLNCRKSKRDHQPQDIDNQGAQQELQSIGTSEVNNGIKPVVEQEKAADLSPAKETEEKKVEEKTPGITVTGVIPEKNIPVSTATAVAPKTVVSKVHKLPPTMSDSNESSAVKTERNVRLKQERPDRPSTPTLKSSVRNSSHRKNKSKKAAKVGWTEESLSKMYDAVPLLDVVKLPRGGTSVETEAVGRVQFGIPPETIKDSMRLGLDVPSIYIVPAEPFCREMGPALGVNLAEFEFPAYFNFFVQRKRCMLIVDSDNAERNIRRVFSETLLGPAQFRAANDPIAYEEEDFAPDFPRDAIPNFEKELKHFRIMPDGHELILETLLNFCHFEKSGDSTKSFDNLAVPPPLVDGGDIDAEMENNEEEEKVLELTEEELVEELKISAYSQVKMCGEVAIIYPPDATQEQIASKTCKRVEIFKMPNWSEYVMHDVDENNTIIGKVRISGNVSVSESMSVAGFGGTDADFQNAEDEDFKDSLVDIPPVVLPPTFHPPSFGVTVLGNSHGFDSSGSVSGYVLWINGRGIMIDPPPYSSATLQREGIRPRTIVGIILTHCHADHDAGAFQKVLYGSPVVVITTPTIYKSFIRKYAALSSLSPALLRHCHRHKPAIIGEPMRFQGAVFHFTYTLHTIPCVGFRVEWRGRSMVFTGDHFNNPEAIDKLQETGVLSKARADDLKNLPLQHTDLLLHEAGAPPIHTPLDVLLKLPQRVKDRLYVVHTQALPEGCELRVAPTGTAQTIRLDEQKVQNKNRREDSLMQSIWQSSEYSDLGDSLGADNSTNLFGETVKEDELYIDDNLYQSTWTSEYTPKTSSMGKNHKKPPLVALRPSSSTDAWFELNLLSAVPFLSNLSYSSTMEVLEIARVDAFCMDDIVLPTERRKEVLCVIWEGTCMEREKLVNGKAASATSPQATRDSKKKRAVWHAGDWTAPRSLQPEKVMSGDSSSSKTHDIVAMSEEGVKVITVDFASLHTILKNGSSLYRTYLAHKCKPANPEMVPLCLQGTITGHLFEDAVRNLSVNEVLDANSSLRKLSAVQKRHLESLAEGPEYYTPGERLWRLGAAVDKAFIIVGGTVSFIAKRRNGGSVGVARTANDGPDFNVEDSGNLSSSLGEMMRQNAARARAELRASTKDDEGYSSSSSISSHISEDRNSHDFDVESNGADSLIDNQEFAKLTLGLQRRAENIKSQTHVKPLKSDESSTDTFDGYSIADQSILSADEVNTDPSVGSTAEGRGGHRRTRRRSSKDRFANKQLERLYNRRAFTAGLVFSRGHFLGDVSKMVAGLLSSNFDSIDDDDASTKYGFGEKQDGDRSINEMVIHEQEGGRLFLHSSTLAAGKDGCVVLVFPKSSLIPLLDEYPGLLLSLLGTQVVL